MRVYRGQILWIYFLVTAANVLANVLAGFGAEHDSWQQWAHVTKFVPMPLLIVYGITAMPAGRVRNVLLASLLFSWMGDVALVFDTGGTVFFLLGLLSFLVAHVLYVALFNLAKDKVMVNNGMGWLRMLIVLPLGFSVWLMTRITPHLGDLKIPVLAYAMVLLFMGFAALGRVKATGMQSFVWVVLGAYLFILSDSLLALQTFDAWLSIAHAWVMVTYWAGQVCIVYGIGKHIALNG